MHAVGNYWFDYNGTDANGDLIGDIPYIIDENNGDNYALIKPYNASSSEPEPLPFSTTLMVVLAVIVAIIGVEFLVYLKKHKR